MNILKYFSLIEPDNISKNHIPQNIKNLLDIICDIKVPCLIQGEFVRKYFHWMDLDIENINIYTLNFDFYLINDIIENNKYTVVEVDIEEKDYLYIKKSLRLIIDGINVNIMIFASLLDIHKHLSYNYLGLDCIVYDYGLKTWLELKIDVSEAWNKSGEKLVTFGIKDRGTYNSGDIIKDDIADRYFYDITIDNSREPSYYNAIRLLSYEYLMNIIMQRYYNTFDRSLIGKSALVTSCLEYNANNRLFAGKELEYSVRRKNSNKSYINTSHTFELAFEASIDKLFKEYNYDTAMTILLEELLKTKSVIIIDKIENDYFSHPVDRDMQLYIPLYGRKYINYIINKIFPGTIRCEDIVFDNRYFAKDIYNQILDLILALKFNNRATDNEIITKFSNVNKSAAILVMISILSSTMFIHEKNNGKGENIYPIKLALDLLSSLKNYVNIDVYNRALCIMDLLINYPLNGSRSDYTEYNQGFNFNSLNEIFMLIKPMLISNAINHKFNPNDVEQLIILYLLISTQIRIDIQPDCYTIPLNKNSINDINELINDSIKRESLYLEKFNSLNIKLKDITRIVSVNSISSFDLLSFLYFGVINGDIKNEKNDLLNNALTYIINSNRGDIQWNTK